MHELWLPIAGSSENFGRSQSFIATTYDKCQTSKCLAARCVPGLSPLHASATDNIEASSARTDRGSDDASTAQSPGKAVIGSSRSSLWDHKKQLVGFKQGQQQRVNLCRLPSQQRLSAAARESVVQGDILHILQPSPGQSEHNKHSQHLQELGHGQQNKRVNKPNPTVLHKHHNVPR